MTLAEKTTIHLLLNILAGIMLMMTRGGNESQLEKEYFEIVKKTTKAAKQLIERE